MMDAGYPALVNLTVIFSESPMDRELLYPGFEELCTIHADLSESMKAAPVQIGVFNQGYKEVKVRRSFVHAACSRLTLRSLRSA
jgi:hypothetical protein